MAAGQLAKAEEAKAAERDPRKVHMLDVRASIERQQPQFKLALPAHVDDGRFTRAALTAINTVPRLAECTTPSILAGLMQAAQLGLEVADVRGQAYLIPRWDGRDKVMKATFQLGYRGMIDLAARSGIDVAAEEIRENDEYDFALGTRRFLRHKPTITSPRGRVIAYYATASFADGRTPAFAIMSVAEVEEHRDKFASQKNKAGDIIGPWVEHFDGMARKTVIRALLNYLPVSVEMRDAVQRDVIEATISEQRPVLVPLSPPDDTPALGEAPPDNVDGDTGEIIDADIVDADTGVE